MITFTFLMITLAVLAVALVITLLTGGVAFAVVFGDLIICIGVIVFIVKIFGKRRRSKK